MAREPTKSRRDTGKTESENAAKAGASEEGAKQNQDADSDGPAELLKQQHQELQASLAKRSESDADHPAVVEEFAMLWLPHQAVEAEILAPVLKNSGMDRAKIAATEIRKDIINILLADLLQNEDDEFVEAKLDMLAGQVEALIEAANPEGESAKAAIAAATAELPSLSSQLKARYERLKQRFADMDESIGEAMVMLAPRRLSVSFKSQPSRREYDMSSRYSNMRERDEQGRFVSDDDQDYRGSSRSRSRYEDDDRSYRGSRGGPERDEHGRFMSEGGGSRSRGRHEDEDERYSRGSMGRERDDEGRFMSEGGGRSRGRYEDEDERYGRRSMGRERDDDGRFTQRGGGSEGRGHGGWFGDSEGHSEASRRGWESGSHGESGWYGDSEGHSEASRRGWEGRGGRHDEMPSRSRSRHEDDERGYRRGDDYERGNGGRGHGGWSGDPEGHSEASRRGWQNRR